MWKIVSMCLIALLGVTPILAFGQEASETDFKEQIIQTSSEIEVQSTEPSQVEEIQTDKNMEDSLPVLSWLVPRILLLSYPPRIIGLAMGMLF